MKKVLIFVLALTALLLFSAAVMADDTEQASGSQDQMAAPDDAAANTQADDGLTVTGEKGLFTVLTGDTVPEGKWSFGIGYNNIDRDPKDVDITYYSATLGYGITDNLEVVAMVTPHVGYDIDPKFALEEPDTVNGKEVLPEIATKHGSEWRDGFGDIQIGAKWVYHHGPHSIGVRPFVKIPTASAEEGVGTRKMDFGFDFLASTTVGNAVEVAGNVGFTFRPDPDYREATGEVTSSESVDIGNPFRWGIGAGFPTNSRLQGIVELTGEVLPNEAEFENSTDLSGGIRWNICHDWYLSAGVRRNLQADNDNHQYPTGGVFLLSYAPGRHKGMVVPPPPPAPPAPAPPPPPAPAPAPAPAPVPEFVWPEVYFPFDEYVITEETRGKLDSVASYMTDHPSVKVTIEGHCCFIGTEEYNLALGQHRADTIKDYLVGKGISADRMNTVSYGESKPKYDNSKEITRRFNRRGFFVVINPE